MFGHGRHGELDPIARAGRNPPAAAGRGERLWYDLAGREAAVAKPIAWR